MHLASPDRTGVNKQQQPVEVDSDPACAASEIKMRFISLVWPCLIWGIM
jgi:hypothetical protein